MIGIHKRQGSFITQCFIFIFFWGGDGGLEWETSELQRPPHPPQNEVLLLEADS
jgi:hypothetical protein